MKDEIHCILKKLDTQRITVPQALESIIKLMDKHNEGETK